MNFSITQILAIAGAAGSLASVGYYALCLWSAANFLRRKAGGSARATLAWPPASVLKPLKGLDPGMYENFRSHCLQDYAEYEIVFGVSDRNDPAAAAVRQLQKEFPQRPIRLLVCEENLGVNTKVSALAQMLRQARHEYIVVNDSDIRVDPGYLKTVIAPLVRDSSQVPGSDDSPAPQNVYADGKQKVGLVTCLYRGVAGPTLGSRLEAVGISTDFAAGVLAARQLEGGVHFGLGSTLAFRRADLLAAGGFEAFVDYLADDYQLGNRLSQGGSHGVLSEAIVETRLPPYRFAEFLAHQLRWARTVRDSRPAGYAGLILTFGLPWALLTLMCSRGAPWAWWLLAIVVAARVAVALVIGRAVLDDRQVMPLLPLLPLRDLVALVVWARALFGNTVVWRGEKFRLRAGKLTRL